MSKKIPVRKIELKNLSPLNKQKLLTEKIYSPSSKSPKKGLMRVAITSKPFVPVQLLKRANRLAKTPKNSDQLSLGINLSATPKGIDYTKKRGASFSSNPIKNLSSETAHARKFSVNSHANLISKHYAISQTGYIPDHPQKQNQDSYLEISNREMSIFGVFDGHGVNGGEVSSYLKNRIPMLLNKGSKDTTSTIKNAILTADGELSKIIDTQLSGSTLNLIVIQGKKLYCANVGDSRSIIGNQINDLTNQSSGKNWMSICLSRDHKPDLFEEATRIHQCGGRVLSYTDENGNPAGPARVWLKEQNLPGLAMSRSIGDSIATSVGVIPEPEILEYTLTSQDKFLVVGSDGLFEFLANEEIVKIVVPFWKTGNIIGACQALVSTAEFRWKTVNSI